MFRVVTLIVTTIAFMLVGLLVAHMTVESVKSFDGNQIITIFAMYPLGGFVLGIITSLIAIKIARSSKNH